ncbi:MAG: efflux RND transporter periplasmic adaptor subunit [Alphaproteobacteria bacterium]|nr:efflux RND transporter periplasmic adaptor subunit [Alphaproteobacteria bacterium]
MHTLLLALLAACTDEPPAVAIDQTPRVEVVRVAAPPTVLERTLLSTLEPARDALLTPMRPGRVVRRAAEPGDRVGRGDAVLELDGREARASLAAAEAAVDEADALVEEARRQRDRVEALGDGAAPAQQDQAGVALARATAALAGAEAQRELARVNLEHMTLRAPFEGQVALLEPEVGESVAPGAGPVARVVDAAEGRVVVGLLEDEVRAADQEGARFEVRASGQTMAASLARLAPAADPRTLAWTAELRVAEPSVPPGTAVEVALSLPIVAAGGLVPPKALRDGHVWRVDADVVHRVPVQVVAEAREGLIVEGVAVGDTLVLYAADALREGQQVVRLEAP